MNARALPLLFALTSPAHALQLDQPEIRFAPDCSVSLTLRLLSGPGMEPEQLGWEIAAPPTYQKFEQAYPSWVATAELTSIRHRGERRIRIRSVEPLPEHASVLLLAIRHRHDPPWFRSLTVPPCVGIGETQYVTRGDTLLEIALRHARGLRVDAQRLMLAILLHNRDAFIRDNINLVRAGSTLYIPSAAEIARLNLPRKWLFNEIRAQNEQWRNWRSRGSDLQASATLHTRRLQLVPLRVQTEPDAPAPVPATVEPKPAPIEPEPVDAEPGPAPTRELPAEESEPAEARVGDAGEADIASTPDAPAAVDDGGIAWYWIPVAAGLIFLYLGILAARRSLRTRRLQRDVRVAETSDPSRRASSALDLAHIQVEMKEYAQARTLLRIVLSDGTAAEREEAKKLQQQIDSAA